jgi:3-oxoacyl-[acyl-carrier protein] reductase
MDLGIAGRNAVVTASSRGLGLAAARELAREGVNLLMCSRGEEALRAAADGIAGETDVKVVAITADVADAADCRRIIDEADRKLGSVDILITNTGGPDPGTFETVDDDAWLRAFENTLMNVVRMIRAAAPAMCQRRWGRIVNVTSTTTRQPLTGLTLSNAFRPAIVGLAKDLSEQYAPHGVLVNNVCPGMYRTDRILHIAQQADDPEAYLEQRAMQIPLGRIGEPNELAAMIAFLCSERASYITGQSILVDGGMYRGYL